MIKNRQKFLIASVIIFLFILPFFVYIARTRQFLFNKAAFGEVTVNIIPETLTKPIGEQFTFEVHANSSAKQVSAITVRLNPSTFGLAIVSIDPAVQSTDAFTDIIYNKDADPFTFTLLAKKATSALPTGSFKLATVTAVSYESGTVSVSVDAANSQAVGYNGTSEDVGLSVTSGTQLVATVTGSLCRIAQCIEPANITLQEQSRTDGKRDITVNWQVSQATQSAVFKLYRNSNAPVPTGHPASNLIGIAGNNTTHFTDTNGGTGFSTGTTVQYDIDSYTICQ